MPRRLEFVFPLPLGLHARPASRLSDLARRFGARVTLANRRTGVEARAASVLALIATFTRHGDPCALVAEGGDEEAAIEALRRFVNEDLPRCDDRDPAAPQAIRVGGPLPRALAAAGARVLRGHSASPGVARARAFVLDPWRECLERADRAPRSVAEEIRDLSRALERVRTEIDARELRATSETERAILSAHRSLLDDEALRSRIEDEVREHDASAGRAVVSAAEHFGAVLRGSGSAYLEERVADLRDLAARILRELPGPAAPREPALPPGESICVAASLGPTELLALGRDRLKGIALSAGGASSHTAILARALGIPCVTGVDRVERRVEGGQEVVVDGERGLIVVEPPESVRAFYDGEARKVEARAARYMAFTSSPGRTADGRRLEVGANVGSTEEARAAFERGAEGLGLFRTELLFLDRKVPPSEDEQATVYAETVSLAAGRPVILRTLDVGGDKRLPYLALPEEANPFLGLRAVRMYGTHTAIVRAQVRAILRASAGGPVRILLPMVGGLEEVRAFRALVVRMREELAAEGVAFDPGVEIGVMVEVPSAALLIDHLAGEADFFSIGSNDLAQYFLAVGRDNPAVSHLSSPYHPAFLRLLRQIADEARRHRRWIGLCGEMAGDLLAVPLLVALGLDEVSVAPPQVPATKAAIRAADSQACRDLLAAVTRQPTAADVERTLREFAAGRRDRSLTAEDLVRLGSGSRTREQAIRELVDLLHLAGRVNDPDRVEEAIWQREDTASTALGFRVAIPHCTSPHVGTDSIAVLTLPRGVDWQAPDGEPVTMAILIVLGEGSDRDAHLRKIAALSRRLMDDGYRNGLMASATPAEMVARLRQATGTGGE